MPPELPPEAQRLLKPPLDLHTLSEKRHVNYRRRWQHFGSLFRSHQQFRRAYREETSEGTRDTMLRDAGREWGAELFIPYSFEVVETVGPRLISNRPKMLVTPRGGAPEEHAENHRFLLDAQQEKAKYELTTATTAKSGLIYGLGIQKAYWRKDPPKQVMRQTDGLYGRVMEAVEMCPYDDPYAENVDIFDFFWDVYASHMGNCRGVIHRLWRDTGSVMRKLITGEWNNPAALPPSEVQFMGSPEKFDEAHRERLEAAGQQDLQNTDDQIHEVWEYHDGDRVIIVLDRIWPVHVMDNPANHRELPFQAFRPTESEYPELPGIGEIEAIEHLQHELNTMRGQRRDNATLALNRPYAYLDGLYEPGDFQFFPGAMWPTPGDPKDSIFPLPIQDIPASGYAEEDRLKQDIERTTGISDPVSGVGDAGQTATGVQQVQFAANVRIAAKTRRLELEVIGPEASQWISLNQQKITASFQLRVPADPNAKDPERRWTWKTLTPDELDGEFLVTPEGGSTAPENPAEQLQRAQFIWNMFRENPQVDQRQLLTHVIKLSGIKQPEAWLLPEQRIPLPFLQLLEEGGIPREAIMAMLQQAQQMEAEQQGQAQGGQASPNGGPPPERQPA